MGALLGFLCWRDADGGDLGRRFALQHRWSKFLPDGRHVLYLAANFSGRPDLNEILVGSLDSAERRSIVNASSNAAYADPGYLFYMRDNSLVVQRFDVKTLTLSGDARSISDDVKYSQLIDQAVFDVAGGNTLVIQSGKGAAQSQLTGVGRG